MESNLPQASLKKQQQTYAPDFSVYPGQTTWPSTALEDVPSYKDGRSEVF